MAKDRVDRDDEDLVRLYLTDIGQYTLLTKDDEVRLAVEHGEECVFQLGERVLVLLQEVVDREPAHVREAAEDEVLKVRGDSPRRRRGAQRGRREMANW